MRSLLAIAALLLAPAAHAQIFSVYATFAPVHMSSVDTGTLSTNSGYQIQYVNYISSNFGGGVTIGVLPLGPVRIGFDLRGSSKPGNNGADLALGGIKVGLKIPIFSLKPYVQGSVGYLGTRTTNLSSPGGGGTFTNQYLAYEILGGVDLPVVHFLDFRLIEIGGGQGIPVGFTSAQNASIFTLGTGVVFHF